MTVDTRPTGYFANCTSGRTWHAATRSWSAVCDPNLHLDDWRAQRAGDLGITRICGRAACVKAWRATVHAPKD